VLKNLLWSANIPKVDVVSQCGAIVVARKESFVPRDGYWNGFSNEGRGTRESLPLQRSKYILLLYAFMHYSYPRCRAIIFCRAFSRRPVHRKLQRFSESHHLPDLLDVR